MLKEKKVIWTSVSMLVFVVWAFCGLLTFLDLETALVYSLFDSLTIIGLFIGLGFILMTFKYKEIITNRIVLTGIITGIIAIIMKIMHYSWTELVLILSVLILISGALYRLFKKKKREVLDVLKVVWFIAFAIGTILKLNHYPGAYKTLIFSSFILWLIIVNFTYIFENKKRLPTKK